MADREKVIMGLECCKKGGPLNLGSFCGVCPYQTELPTICFFRLRDDAIDLLKEQEAVDKNTGEWKNGHCSCCGEDVASMLDTWTNVQNFPFCPICGAKQKR